MTEDIQDAAYSIKQDQLFRSIVFSKEKKYLKK